MVKLKLINIDSFLGVDMRIGEVIQAESFKEAIKPALKLWIQFGDDIGLKKSSAQITENYSAESLVGKKVVAVVNLKPRQIASFVSEVLVLGALSPSGITLLTIDKDVKLGERVH